MMLEYRDIEVHEDFMVIEVDNKNEEVTFEIYNINDIGDTDYNIVVLSREQVVDMISKLQSKLYE